MEIHETLPEPNETDVDPDQKMEEYQKVATQLTTYFLPKRNIDYERFVFREARQASDETVDVFHTKLQQLAATCEFAAKDAEVKPQLIRGYTSIRLRRRALREKLTLTQLLDMARSLELAETQASGMERGVTKTPDAANAVQLKKFTRRRWKKSPQKARSEQQQQEKKRFCFQCGGEYPHLSTCPAKGRTCEACGKPNDFAKYCRSKKFTESSPEWDVKIKPVLDLEADGDSDGYSFSVSSTVKPMMPGVNITIQGKPLNILVDTGSCMNIIPEPTFKEIQPDVQLQPASNKVYAFDNNEPLAVAGKFTASVRYNQRQTTTSFLVTRRGDTALLSYATASELDIIKISGNNVSTRSDVIKEKYKDLFMGIGKLKGVQVKLHEDKSVTPVTQPHLRIPYHVRARDTARKEKMKTRADARVHHPP